MKEVNNLFDSLRKGAGYRRIRLPGRAAAGLLLGCLVFCAVGTFSGMAAAGAQTSGTAGVQALTAAGVQTPGTAGAQTSGTAAEQTGPVGLSVEYGYDNAAKGGRYLPLRVTVTNDTEEPIAGTLQIKSMESDGTVYRYDFPVGVDAFAETVLEKYISLGTRASRLYLALADASGAEIARTRVKLNVSLDVPELFIGLLSDDPQQLRYLDGVGVSYGTLRTRTFVMDAEDIPEDEVGLNLLDMLVVNDYKLRNLSEKQTAAVMDWVHSGGVLFLGTGDRVDDTLGRFAPELLDDSYDAPGICMVDLGEEFVLEDAGSGMMAISCVNIPLHGGNVIISSAGMPLLTVAAKEKGLIAVSAFDLGDIASFCERQTSFVDYMLTELLGESRIDEIAEVVYGGDSDQFWSVQSLINTGNLKKLPKLPVYAAIVVVYLFLLGPGLYLFLRGRELQIYYRRGVVGLSLMFAVAIYLVGGTTRFRSVFFTYATVIDATEDYLTDTTYVNVRNPYSSPYTVELQPGYSVRPITRTGSTLSTEFPEDAEYQVAIRQEDERLTIQGQNITAFTPRYFRLEQKRDNVEQVGITGEIDYFEGKIGGSITNGFPYPLENTTLILYGSVIYLGRMEAGETMRLDELPRYRFPMGSTYVLAEWISGERKFAEANIDDMRYLLAMKRSSMLEFYLNSYMGSYTADARVIAFSTEKEESQFLLDGSQETYGLTMLTSAVAVNASRESRLYRSVLMKTPKVVTGEYDARSNSMSGLEPLTLEYQMGTDIRVESLTFEPVSEEFFDEGRNDYITAFTGGIYFYNHSTGRFDRMETDGRTMDVSELGEYLSPGNILTVRYVYEGTESYRAIQLPMPMVAGREQ